MPLILSGDTGPSFVQAAAQPVGTVLQIVNASNTAYTVVSQQTWTTAVSAAITPRSTSSKIVILGHVHCGNGSASNSVGLRIYRNSTAISTGTSTVETHSAENLQAGSAWMTVTIPAHYVDSPASTSSITYSLKAASWENNLILNGSNNDSASFSSGNAYGTCQIILMEIQG